MQITGINNLLVLIKKNPHLKLKTQVSGEQNIGDIGKITPVGIQVNGKFYRWDKIKMPNNKLVIYYGDSHEDEIIFSKDEQDLKKYPNVDLKDLDWFNSY
jgi:hypothetical protein